MLKDILKSAGAALALGAIDRAGKSKKPAKKAEPTV